MKNYLFIAVGIAFLAACSFIPDFKRPAVEPPLKWSGAPTEATVIARDWWTSFDSAELNQLMDLALGNNTDIAASLQRVEQARALLKIAGANLLPAVDATAGAERNRATRPDSMRTSLTAGAGVSYELDLFGANRANIESAGATLKATEFDHEALKLVIMSEVARTYFNVLNARERLRIADSNLKNNREVLRIVQARYDAGASDALELAQQKSALATTEAARATVEQSINNAENALAVLLGKPPQSLVVTAGDLKTMNVPSVAPEQPSALLERRPDIRAAEADLVAANADIGAAQAAFFPTVSLGLNGSLAAAGLGDPLSTGIGLSSSLLAPIFEGGRLEGGVEQATARQRELVEIYRKTVLVAFQDVEDALAAVKAAQARETALNTAMQEARKSYELSRSRYDAGTIDFQTLLDSQRTQLQAEDSFAQSKNERLAAAVDLYKALGGGWSQVAAAPRDPVAGIRTSPAAQAPAR